MIKGLSILRWVGGLDLSDVAPQGSPSLLRAALLGEGGTVASEEAIEVAGVDGSSFGDARVGGVGGVSNAELLGIFRELASTHIQERLYLQRLRIVKLAMLTSPTSGRATTSGKARASGKERKGGGSGKGGAPTLGAVLAAWKLLRSDDGKAQAAALEVVESALDGALASLVMPLLDNSPLDKQLRVGEAVFPEVRLPHRRSPPLWVESWLTGAGDNLGLELGELCAAIAGSATSRLHAAASTVELPTAGGLMGSYALRALSASLTRLPTMEPPTSSASQHAATSLSSNNKLRPLPISIGDGDSRGRGEGLLVRTVLLRNAPLLRNLLTLHVANLAARTFERHVAAGERFCRTGEAYIVIHGVAHKAGHPDRSYVRGAIVQQLGCIYDQLPPLDVVASSSADSDSSAALRLLVIPHAAVWDILTHSPPRFGLSLLRGLVQLGGAGGGGAGACSAEGMALAGGERREQPFSLVTPSALLSTTARAADEPDSVAPSAAQRSPRPSPKASRRASPRRDATPRRETSGSNAGASDATEAAEMAEAEAVQAAKEEEEQFYADQANFISVGDVSAAAEDEDEETEEVMIGTPDEQTADDEISSHTDSFTNEGRLTSGSRPGTCL